MSVTTPMPRPRVVLLTLPTLFGAEIINRLADESGIELVGVGLSVRLLKNKGNLASILEFRRRVGWRYLLAGGLEADVSWAALRLTGRPSGLKKVAGQVRPLRDVNSIETRDWLRGLQVDYIVSFYFNQWIGADVCAVPKRACINVHPSLLPALRGPDPVFRALERGQTTTGITIHEVAKEIDAGRVLHQEPRPIPPGISRFGFYHSLIRDGADLAARWVAGRVASKALESAQPQADDYMSFPSTAEVRAWLRAGHRLIGLSEWRRALSAVR